MALLPAILIKKYFPGAKRILVNGNVDWDWSLGSSCTWYKFIEVVLRQEESTEYFIHIDEDCFLTNPDGICEYL